jgi:hypothetical protein
MRNPERTVFAALPVSDVELTGRHIHIAHAKRAQLRDTQTRLEHHADHAQIFQP